MQNRGQSQLPSFKMGRHEVSCEIRQTNPNPKKQHKSTIQHWDFRPKENGSYEQRSTIPLHI